MTSRIGLWQGRSRSRDYVARNLMPCYAEHGSGELWIDFSQLRRHDLSQQAQRVVAGSGRGLDNFGAVVIEAGLLCDFRNAVSRMDAVQPKPPPLAIEAEQAAAGHQRDRPAWPVDIGRI